MGEITAVVVSSNKVLGGGLCIFERSKEVEEQIRRMKWHSTFMEMRTVGCFQGRGNRCL